MLRAVLFDLDGTLHDRPQSLRRFLPDQFRRLPAALLVSFNLTLFLAFPICYIGLRGSDYDFAGRFAAPGGGSRRAR